MRTRKPNTNAKVAEAMERIMINCDASQLQVYQDVYDVCKQRRKATWPVAWQLAVYAGKEITSKTAARTAAAIILAEGHVPGRKVSLED